MQSAEVGSVWAGGPVRVEAVKKGHLRQLHGQGSDSIWEFLKIRGTLFWGPYIKDPII